MKVNNPHDSFFKEMFSQPKVAHDFIENYLPQEITTKLDLSNLKPIKGSFIDNKLKNSQADLLFSTRLKSSSAYIYILFEHKSKPDEWAAFQLLRYSVRIWEKYLNESKDTKILPIILPVIFYHGKRSWNISTKFIDLFATESIEIFKESIPQFEYIIKDLSLINESQLKGDLLLQATLFLLKNIFSKDLPNKIDKFIKIVEKIDEPESKIIDLLQKFLIYIIGGSKKEYRTEIFKSLNNTTNIVRKTMKTIYDSILEEGIEKGIQKGVEKGLKQGRKDGILVGQHKAKIESAKNFFNNGVPIEIIASSTGLSKKELKKHGIK